jgi:hypothetical protein
MNIAGSHTGQFGRESITVRRAHRVHARRERRHRLRGGLSPESQAVVVPPEIFVTKMKRSNYPLQEILTMPLKSRSDGSSTLRQKAFVFNSFR